MADSYEKLPREAECKRTVARFNELLEHLFDYARRKGHVDVPFAEYTALAEEWEQYPEGWEGNVLGMLAAQAVVGNKKRAAAFCRGAEKVLTDSQLAIARRWKRLPWFFAAFRVVEEYGDGLLEIAPFGEPPTTWPQDESWDTLLLYSRTVADIYRHGSSLVLAQLWKGEHAFHTYGVILDLPTMAAEDLFFFADIEEHLDVDPGEVPLLGRNTRTRTLSDSIARSPLLYLQLLRYAEAPRVTNRNGEQAGFFAAVTALSPSGGQLPGGDHAAGYSESELRSRIEATGHSIDEVIVAEDAGAIFPGEGSPMLDAEVYFSGATGRAYLRAASLEAYQRGRQAVAALWSFPEEPAARATLPAFMAARGILDYEDELMQLQELFGEDRGIAPEPEQPEEELEEPDGNLPSMDELQSILNRLTENANEGRTQSDEEVGVALGLDPAMIAPVRAQVEELLGRQAARAGEAADRFGLSPRAFHELTRGGVPAAEGALVLREEQAVRQIATSSAELEALLDEAPAYRLAHWLLEKAIAEGGISATKAGYVGTKVVKEAFDLRLIPRYFGEASFVGELELWEVPKKESDWPVFEYLRELLEAARLLRYDGKRFVPLDPAPDLLADRLSLYLHLLKRIFSKFPWDDHPRFEPLPMLRNYAGFLFYAAEKLRREAGEDAWVPAAYLADRFIAAAPPVAAAVAKDEESRGPREPYSMALRGYIASQVQAGFLYRFAWPFGLIELQYTERHNLHFRLTPLSGLVFRS